MQKRVSYPQSFALEAFSIFRLDFFSLSSACVNFSTSIKNENGTRAGGSFVRLPEATREDWKRLPAAVTKAEWKFTSGTDFNDSCRSAESAQCAAGKRRARALRVLLYGLATDFIRWTLTFLYLHENVYVTSDMEFMMMTTWLREPMHRESPRVGPGQRALEAWKSPFAECCRRCDSSLAFRRVATRSVAQ